MGDDFDMSYTLSMVDVYAISHGESQDVENQLDNVCNWDVNQERVIYDFLGRRWEEPLEYESLSHGVCPLIFVSTEDSELHTGYHQIGGSILVRKCESKEILGVLHVETGGNDPFSFDHDLCHHYLQQHSVSHSRKKKLLKLCNKSIKNIASHIASGGISHADFIGLPKRVEAMDSIIELESFEDADPANGHYGTHEKEMRLWSKERKCVIDDIVRHGFSCITPVIAGKDGETSFKLGPYLCYFTPYVKPMEPKVGVNLRHAMEILSLFHCRSGINALESSGIEGLLYACRTFSTEMIVDVEDLFSGNLIGIAYEYEKWKKYFILAEYFSTSEFRDKYNALPKCVVHGNLRPSSMVMLSDWSATIVDVGMMRQDVRLFDICNTLTCPEYVDEYLSLVNENQVISFMDAYYGKLTDVENLNFQMMMVFCLINRLSLELGKYHTLLRRRNKIQHLKWWADNTDYALEKCRNKIIKICGVIDRIHVNL